jgi:hypothetical protein
MKNANLTHDNLDDRRELHLLLHRLPPQRRVDFLNWCCSQARLGRHEAAIKVSRRVAPTLALAHKSDEHDAKLTMDLYLDLWTLATHYSFDLDRAMVRLEGLVRKAT